MPQHLRLSALLPGLKRRRRRASAGPAESADVGGPPSVPPSAPLVEEAVRGGFLVDNRAPAVDVLPGRSGRLGRRASKGAAALSPAPGGAEPAGQTGRTGPIDEPLAMQATPMDAPAQPGEEEYSLRVTAGRDAAVSRLDESESAPGAPSGSPPAVLAAEPAPSPAEVAPLVAPVGSPFEWLPPESSAEVAARHHAMQ